jgi:phosphoribosyl 1,2-cyclic phosphodiesterase
LYGTKPYSHPDLAQFKTEEFAGAYLENERRRTIPKPTNHIFINPDETVVHWDGTFIHSYNTINEIGEDLRSKLSLVKMLESNEMIAEVGMKISPVSFWLYQ